jgi:hypothetical protein
VTARRKRCRAAVDQRGTRAMSPVQCTRVATGDADLGWSAGVLPACTQHRRPGMTPGAYSPVLRGWHAAVEEYMR